MRKKPKIIVSCVPSYRSLNSNIRILARRTLRPQGREEMKK